MPIPTVVREATIQRPVELAMGSSRAYSQTLRWLRPSLTDIFLLFAIYWLCIASPGSWQSLLKDGDTGMHLRTGDWILAHKQVPAKDLFSYTQPESPWYAFQWGSAVLYSALNSAWGIKAIAFLAGVTIALWVTVMMQAMIAMRVHGILAAVLALAGANAASIHYLARPHLFTMLFLALSVWLVERDRERPSWRIWLLAPLTVVWTNVHSGFVILFVYLAVVAGGLLLEHFAGASTLRGVKRYALVACACAAASVVNPYGIRLHLHILNFLSGPVATSLVDEYQSPKFRGEPQYWFLILLFGALMLAGVDLLRKRIADAALIAVFGAMALVSARNIPLALTIMLPLAGRALTRIWGKAARIAGHGSVLKTFYLQGGSFAARCFGFTVWAGVVIVAMAWLTPAASWPTGLDPKYFPQKLIQRNDALLGSARVLTTDQWGDDLIYLYQGRQRVFVDGRSDFYQPGVMQDYVSMMNAGPNWKGLLDRYKIEVALTPAGSPLSSLLAEDKSWTRRDRDADADIFVRNAPLVAAH
jgi:hypothetical protein